MKFSIASTLLLANGIAAMPWSSLSTKQPNGEEITLRIQVSQPSSNHAFSPNHKVSSTSTTTRSASRSAGPRSQHTLRAGTPRNL
nr:hypothetical protein FVER53263_01598 [Fusarium verticillioides]